MANVSGESAASWFHLADELLDESVTREESVTLRAEDLTVDVPLSFTDDGPAERARWRFDGQVTVTVEGMRRPLAEWDHLFREPPRRPTEHDRASGPADDEDAPAGPSRD